MRGNAGWQRMRLIARILSLTALIAAPVAIYVGIWADVSSWFLFAAALATPFLWPRRFGSWLAFGLVALLLVAPAIFTRWGWLSVDSSPLAFFAALLCFLVGSAMLPGTMLMLLRRRWASVSLILLSMVGLSPAILVFLLTRAYTLDPLAATPGEFVMKVGATAPLSIITMALCLAPLFFVGSLLWLVYQESAGGAMAAG